VTLIQVPKLLAPRDFYGYDGACKGLNTSSLGTTPTQSNLAESNFADSRCTFAFEQIPKKQEAIDFSPTLVPLSFEIKAIHL
jgi:hypothetical protein